MVHYGTREGRRSPMTAANLNSRHSSNRDIRIPSPEGEWRHTAGLLHKSLLMCMIVTISINETFTLETRSKQAISHTVHTPIINNQTIYRNRTYSIIRKHAKQQYSMSHRHEVSIRIQTNFRDRSIVLHRAFPTFTGSDKQFKCARDALDSYLL